jgi:putative oxidoreductase
MSFLSRLSAFEQFGLLLLRVGSGLFLAFLHGWGKITSLWGHLFRGEDWGFPGTVASLGFPFPLFFAGIATFVEFIGGLLFAAGLYTRYVSLLIAITMSVAVYRHLISDMRYELAALFLLISLYLLFRGAGRYSCDRFFKTGSY